MASLPYIDPLVRYAAIILLLLVALLCARDGWAYRTVRLAAALTLSSVGVIISTSYGYIDIPQPLFTLARFVDIPVLALVWLFGLSLFQDDFRPASWAWIWIGLYTCSSLIFRLRNLGFVEFSPIVYNICNLVSDTAAVILMTHLAYVTWRDRSGDLVEARRRFRVPFAFSMAFVGAYTILGEEIFTGNSAYFLNLTRVLLILALAFWAFWQITRLSPERLTFEKVIIQKATVQVINDQEDQALSTSDPVLFELLTKTMNEARLYREQGLTISALAHHLNRPEHQVRRFINTELGARNFTQYLNGFRLDEAATRLSAPEDYRTPVLTIAMDVGFSSLAPFNRAFKDRFGMTPTEYRKQK